jgi:predicted esterase
MRITHFNITFLATGLVVCLAVSTTLAQETIRLPGHGDITVYLLSPSGETNRVPPLCVILPPGDGATSRAQETMGGPGKQFVERGWTVAVPVSPDTKSFFGPNSVKVRTMIRELIKRPGVADQKIVLAGISNGGIAAFQIASEEPNLVAGIVAMPGTVWPSVNLRGLMGKPIFYRVGADDQLGWAKTFHSHSDNLRRAGAVVDARLLPKTGHVFEVDWKELDAWLHKSLGKQHPRPLPAR